MKKLSILLAGLLFQSTVWGDEVKGKISFSTIEDIPLEVPVQVGIGFYDKLDVNVDKDFPIYIKAFAEATASSSYVYLSKDGTYSLGDMDKSVGGMILINFGGLSYFYKCTVSDDIEQYSRVIDLKVESRDFKLEISDEGGQAIEEKIIFLVQQGSEGFVVQKFKPGESEVVYNNVPEGIYNLIVLTRAEEGKPDNCFIQEIKVSKEMEELTKVMVK